MNSKMSKLIIIKIVSTKQQKIIISIYNESSIIIENKRNARINKIINKKL